tara:strand:- start:67 stop:573 length:507 start_codon:yes stop_codon:yes gene_type:complete
MKIIIVLKDLIKYLLSFLQTVYIFESKKNKKPIKYKNIYLKKFKSINEIENKNLKNYLIKEEKNKRFRKNCYLLALFFKKDLVSMGWMNEGITWRIDEKNKKIDIKDKILLFDFYTLEKFRNKGYYNKLLNLIKNFKTKKIFLIYSLKRNKASVKGILRSNFKLKKII